MATKIEWAEETYNPIIGCSKVSPGCANCYAERMAGRLANIQSQVGNYGHVVEWDDHPQLPLPIGQWNGKTHVVASALEKPLHWKKPRTIFVCSMGDLFHESVNFNDIVEIMFMIKRCPQHTFLILTKRAQRMHEFFTDWVPNPFWINGEFLPNVWLGVTAENQETANERIPVLLDIPAAKRFVSIEPMLGPVSFDVGIGTGASSLGLHGLDWVICGGESGPGARPMHPEWPRQLHKQCEEANTPFMFKQWGDWVPMVYFNDGKPFLNLTPGKKEIIMKEPFMINMVRVGKKKAGRKLNGKIYDQKPE